MPGTIPVLLNISVLNPAAEVPRAVLTIAVATARPSPGCDMLPYIMKADNLYALI